MIILDVAGKREEIDGQLNPDDFKDNIIPNEWYHHILSKAGKPNLLAIVLLADITYRYHHRVIQGTCTGDKININQFVGKLWQTSYDYFEKKFACNHQKVRRALVRLEELGLIKRVIRSIYLNGQKFCNILFIKLNVKALTKITKPSSTNQKSKKDLISK